MKYKVVQYSKLGMKSEILPEYHAESFAIFDNLPDAIKQIEHWHNVQGWRVFELKTVEPE